MLGYSSTQGADCGAALLWGRVWQTHIKAAIQIIGAADRASDWEQKQKRVLRMAKVEQQLDQMRSVFYACVQRHYIKGLNHHLGDSAAD